MKPFSLPSTVAGDVLATRPSTIVHFFNIGPLTIMWDTGRPAPDRDPGQA